MGASQCKQTGNNAEVEYNVGAARWSEDSEKSALEWLQISAQ